MPEQQIKLYQLGTFAVGNRLLDPERALGAGSDGALEHAHLRSPRLPGLRRGARRTLRARCRDARHRRPADRRQRDGVPRSLLDARIRSRPGSCPGSTRCSATLRRSRPGSPPRSARKGRTDVSVIGQGGDGGTLDIGFACLSGMFERNDDVLYICYDNEAYMNTGVQRSSATPPAARTATTKPVGAEPGNVFGQGKNAPLIAMAHEIPYVATATVAELRDLEAKVERAMELSGARYLHVFVPCPLGWGSASRDTIRIARLAKETGLFPVFEAEHGEVVERLEAPPAGAGRGVPASRSAASRTCSATTPARTWSRGSRRSPTATSAGSACSPRTTPARG